MPVSFLSNDQRARCTGAAKASAILRLPVLRRLATLVAFVHCLEASAQDDALEVLEVILLVRGELRPLRNPASDE